jgi:hypothetical protein
MAKLTAQFDYTDAELLALYREALAALSQNKSYTIRGKSLTRTDLPQVREMIDWLERRVDAAAGNSAVVIGRHARRT